MGRGGVGGRGIRAAAERNQEYSMCSAGLAFACANHLDRHVSGRARQRGGGMQEALTTREGLLIAGG